MTARHRRLVLLFCAFIVSSCLFIFFTTFFKPTTANAPHPSATSTPLTTYGQYSVDFGTPDYIRVYYFSTASDLAPHSTRTITDSEQITAITSLLTSFPSVGEEYRNISPSTPRTQVVAFTKLGVIAHVTFFGEYLQAPNTAFYDPAHDTFTNNQTRLYQLISLNE